MRIMFSKTMLLFKDTVWTKINWAWILSLVKWPIVYKKTFALVEETYFNIGSPTSRTNSYNQNNGFF